MSSEGSANYHLVALLHTSATSMVVRYFRQRYDAVQDISVRYFIHKYPDYSYEKALEVQDMISDLEAKYQASDLYFEQDTLDIYRPGIPHDQRWAAMTFIELMFYAISPDSYTKEVHEMMPEEDSERTRMQTQI